MSDFADVDITFSGPDLGFFWVLLSTNYQSFLEVFLLLQESVLDCNFRHFIISSLT